jgi:hypothetical protein
MEKTLFELASLLLVVGVVFHILAFRHRSLEFPDVFKLKNLKPKSWKPVWQSSSYYDQKGYIYALLSATCIVLAGIVTLFHDHLYDYFAG